MQSHTPTVSWLNQAVGLIEADYLRSADTHLIPLPLPAFAAHGIDLYLKDESTHPTGSLKHRLARSLFLDGLPSRLVGCSSRHGSGSGISSGPATAGSKITPQMKTAIFGADERMDSPPQVLSTCLQNLLPADGCIRQRKV